MRYNLIFLSETCIAHKIPIYDKAAWDGFLRKKKVKYFSSK